MDAEARTGDGDEEQRASGNARGAAGADGRDDAEEQCRRHVDLDAERVCGGEREDGDRDGGAAHIDRRAERDGERIGVLRQSEALAQREVHGDVRRRTAREEGVDAAFPERRPDEWEGVAADVQEDDERVHDERDGEERREENGEELRVADERSETAFADGVCDEAEDAEGSEADDPLHDLRHSFGEVGDRLLRRVVR